MDRIDAWIIKFQHRALYSCKIHLCITSECVFFPAPHTHICVVAFAGKSIILRLFRSSTCKYEKVKPKKKKKIKTTRAHIKVWITITIIEWLFEVSLNIFCDEPSSKRTISHYGDREQVEEDATSSADMEAIDKSLFRELYRFFKAILGKSYIRVS